MYCSEGEYRRRKSILQNSFKGQIVTHSILQNKSERVYLRVQGKIFDKEI
jgi:hypothetical protein